jgi:FtsP/CotA-like multicopper oxidase with cupredoxin domain
MATPRKRLSLIAVLVAATLPSSLPTTAGPRVPLGQPVQACEDPSDFKTIYADEVGNGKIGYGTTQKSVRVPGPTLFMTEGTCLEVNLINKTKQPVSMHTHGVKYTFESDGTPHNKGCVAPGEAGSFVFEAELPGANPQPGGTISPGSAGYWHYHDHCTGSPHGTGGVARGLYGALIVRREGDPRPDRRPFVVVMNGVTINNKLAPRTPIFTANQGERVEFVVITHGENFHTFHMHAHSWFDNRTGTTTVPTDAAVIDNKAVGPADSFGFQVIAGEGVGPGAWMYHCHVQSHSDGGMSGLFVVRTEGGVKTPQTKRAIERWKKQHRGGHHG